MIFGTQFQKPREEQFTTRESLEFRSETLRYWADQLRSRYPGDTRIEQILERLPSDERLEHFLLKTISENPQSAVTPEQTVALVAFHEKHPDWWSQNFESFFERFDQVARETSTGPIDAFKWDVVSGIGAGVYGFGKGIVTGVVDLVRYGYNLSTDAQVRTDAFNKMVALQKLYLRLRFGTAEQQMEAARQIGEFTQGLYSSISAEIQKEWQAATDEKTRTQLITKWTTRGVLEIATVAIGALKGGKALSVGKAATGGLNLSREAVDFGLKLTQRIKSLQIEIDGAYTVLRMQRFDQYRLRMKGIRGIKGTKKVYRGVPKGSTFPFYDAHPSSLSRLGYRWHLPGEKAVYFGSSRNVTMQEMAKHYGTHWKATHELHSIDIKYRNALDMTNPKVLKKLGLDPKVLYSNDASHAQVISNIARSMGFDAVIANSAADASKAPNIILLRKEL